MPPIVRWILQVVLPVWISVMPNIAIHFARGTLTWDTAIEGPDLHIFTMTVSVTSVIGLLSVSPNLSLASLKPWRVYFAFFFVFLFLVADVFRLIHKISLDRARAPFGPFEAFRIAQTVDLVGVCLAGIAVLATLAIISIEICECLRSDEGCPT